MSQTLWAVIVRPRRGPEWVHWYTLRIRRRDALAAYDEIVGAGAFKAKAKEGRARVGRVRLEVVSDPGEDDTRHEHRNR